MGVAQGSLNSTRSSGPTAVTVIFIILVIVAIIAGGGYATWYHLRHGGKRAAVEAGVPLIKADNSRKLRLKPADPGGLNVPFKDKLIFERMKPGKIIELGERLLPPPEQPVEKPVPKARKAAEPNLPPAPKPIDDKVVAAAEAEGKAEAAGKLAEKSGGATVGKAVPEQSRTIVLPTGPKPGKQESVIQEPKPEVKAKSAEQAPKAAPPRPPAVAAKPPPQAAKPVPPDSAKPAEKAPPAEKPAPETVLKPAPKPAPKPTQETIQKPAKKPASPAAPAPKKLALLSGYGVQLAAFRDPNAAGKSWRVLSKKHAALLGSLQHFILKADLGKRGIYYKLQVGPLADRAKAVQLCSRLKAQKQGCFVVRGKS